MDKQDSLACFRAQFHIPGVAGGAESIYLSGNSLGLQPKKAREYILQELSDWAALGVEGHWAAGHPWVSYHEILTDATARLVGARPLEVVVMNTLTVNLHLMMVSFYTPAKERFKILLEAGAFPSDQYAAASQAEFHGFNPEEAVREVAPRPGESTIRQEDILSAIEKEGQSIALVLLGDVNYLTGQAFDIAAITKAAHSKGCCVGLNLAHGAGNLELSLHNWGVDFAVWCSYKYLNAGPGGLAGCFVHERHANRSKLPRFAGWWGHNKNARFQMGRHFNAIPGAEGWQLSNPPILQMAALRASMEIFDQATMKAVRQKSVLLTGYLEYLIDKMPGMLVEIITPRNPEERGCQLSFKVHLDPQKLQDKLKAAGAIIDFRRPDILRAAPAPLYNSFTDIYCFAELMRRHLEE